MPSPTAPNFPFDDALKGVEVLLDPERMRHRVQEGFGVHGRLARLRIKVKIHDRRIKNSGIDRNG